MQGHATGGRSLRQLFPLDYKVVKVQLERERESENIVLQRIDRV